MRNDCHCNLHVSLHEVIISLIYIKNMIFFKEILKSV